MVNEWNKTALVEEFDTMLRRRLRSGAAPVAACAGFDIDAASAYLEGALGGSHRTGYESHLAGCVTCRRHLVELARLAQCAPLADPQPASAPNQIPVWGRWKEAVAAWFDISSRGFKWQIASATGAAFAILIAALGLQSLRQVSKQPAETIADSAVPANPTGQTGPVEPLAQSIQSPTLESSPQNEALQDGATSIAPGATAIYPERLQIPAPTPLVGPQGNDPNFSFNASNRAMAESSNLPVEAPVAPKPMPSAAQAGQNSQPLDAFSTESRAEFNGQRLSGRIEDLEELAAVRRQYRKEGAAKDTVQNLSAPPRINRMKSVPPDPVVRNGWISSYVSKEQATPNSESNSKADKSRIKDAWASVSSIVKRPIKWPFSDSEKPSRDAQETSDAASLTPLEWPFRGKVFVLKKGMWIDREYKSEMQEWRCWTLTRGSDQYKRVLSEEPQLKDFFDKGPILIVWKNRIYKVQ